MNNKIFKALFKLKIILTYFKILKLVNKLQQCFEKDGFCLVVMLLIWTFSPKITLIIDYGVCILGELCKLVQ